MNTVQRYLKNFLSIISAEIIVKFLSVFILAYLARTIGPEKFGQLFFAIAIVSYFYIISTFGLDIFGTREVARIRDERKKGIQFVSNIVSLRIVFSIVLFGLLIITSYMIPQLYRLRYLIILAGLTVIFPKNFFDWIFQGYEKMEYIGIGSVINQLIYAILIFSLVRETSSILLIPIFQLIAILVSMVFLFWIMTKEIGKIKFFDINLNFSKNILPRIVPLGVSVLMIQIFYNIDIVLLGLFKGDEVVGYYSAAYKIILLLIGVAGMLHNPLYPVISNYYKTSIESLKKTINISFTFMAIVAFPLVIGITVIAGKIITLLYTTKYIKSVLPFQILIWAVFIVFINITFSRGLLACNKEKSFFWGTTIPAIVNLALNLILIPLYSMTGAAIATVAAELSGFIIMYREFNKIIKIPFLQYIYKPLLASIGMLVLLNFISDYSLPLLILSGASFYILLLALMKGIPVEEIKFIKELVLGKNKEVLITAN